MRVEFCLADIGFNPHFPIIIAKENWNPIFIYFMQQEEPQKIITPIRFNDYIAI